MNEARISAALLLTAGFLLTPLAAAGTSPETLWLKLGEFKGDTREAPHRDWIGVIAVSRAIASPRDVATGQASGKRQHGEIQFTKLVDKSSPGLSRAAATGQHFDTAVLEGRGTRLVMHDVLVSSIQQGAGHGDAVPTETVTLNYASFEGADGPANPTPAPTKPLSAAIQVAPGAASAVLAAIPLEITKVTPSASSVNAGATVTFTVEATGDCNRSRIDFGDGSPVVEYPIVARKSLPPPAHAYAKGGTFEVKAYGLADPMAKLPAPPKASDHACAGHATTSVAIKATMAVAPALRK
jgi:type VI secretion system secreted protein Hcp